MTINLYDNIMIKGIIVDPKIKAITQVNIEEALAGDWERSWKVTIGNIIESKKIAKVIVDDQNAIYLDSALLSDPDKLIERSAEVWSWLGQDRSFVGKGLLLGHSQDSDVPTSTSFVPSRVGEYASLAETEIVELDS